MTSTANAVEVFSFQWNRHQTTIYNVFFVFSCTNINKLIPYKSLQKKSGTFAHCCYVINSTKNERIKYILYGQK